MHQEQLISNRGKELIVNRWREVGSYKERLVDGSNEDRDKESKHSVGVGRREWKSGLESSGRGRIAESLSEGGTVSPSTSVWNHLHHCYRMSKFLSTRTPDSTIPPHPIISCLYKVMQQQEHNQCGSLKEYQNNLVALTGSTLVSDIVDCWAR